MVTPIQPNQEVEKYGNEWFASQYDRCFVDTKISVEKPETIISIGKHQYKGNWYDTPVMTAGEFSVISAPSKSKKTFFKSQLCASYIGGNANNFFRNIKGHRKEDEIIIDCDTEQSKYYAHRTFSRIEKIVGAPYSGYLPFKMRHLNPEERIAFIDKIIDRHKGEVKLVFIDGIADLIEDTNDLVMSNYIAGKLLKWTDTYGIHICTIIHNAYGVKKPTGHLGSAVVKKAETLFQLIPSETTDIIEVNHQYSRGFPFETFYFRVNNDNALIYECDVNGNFIETPFSKNEIQSEKHQEKTLPTIDVKQAFDGGVPF